MKTLYFLMALLVTSAVGLAALAKTPAAPQASGSTVNVSIKNMRYNPATIKIHVGDTVNWTNDDDRDHTVTADDGSFDSGNLKSGQSYSYTFTTAGNYAYSCSLRPRMRGMVVVE